MTQEQLRKEVKSLKAFQNISYKEISQLLQIKQDSFYSFLRNNYDLGEVKSAQLKEIICNLKE